MKPNPTQIIADIEKLNSDFKASSKSLLEAAFIALDDLKGIVRYDREDEQLTEQQQSEVNSMIDLVSDMFYSLQGALELVYDFSEGTQLTIERNPETNKFEIIETEYDCGY